MRLARVLAAATTTSSSSGASPFLGVRGVAAAAASSASSSSSTTTTTPPVVDVCIVGGGVVGTALACVLRSTPLTSHLSVMLADRAPPPSSAWLDANPSRHPEPRVSALTPLSIRFLRDVGAWDRVSNARARPFKTMQVWDDASNGHVRYDAREVGEDALGAVVENVVIHAALHEAATRLGVIFPPPSSLASLDLGGDPGTLASVEFEEEEEEKKKKKKKKKKKAENGDGGGGADGAREARRRVRARLVVAADGASSRTRTLAGLTVAGWSYHRKAAVGTVRTAIAHDTAWQRFLPNGPLALLPIVGEGTGDGEGGGDEGAAGGGGGSGGGGLSNVVWTTTNEDADRLCKLSDEDFAAEVHAALRSEGKYAVKTSPAWGSDAAAADADADDGGGAENVGRSDFDRLQTSFVDSLLRPASKLALRGVGVAAASPAPAFELPPAVVGASGARGAFPLATRLAGRYSLRRLALVGDAAHQARSISHWSPYDRVRVVNADP